MSWVLVILTGVIIQGSAGGAAATNVPGFRSAAECQQAAAQIKADARQQVPGSSAVILVSASCVTQ